MASRTGLQASIKLLKHFCVIYAHYYNRMVDAINNSTIGTSQQKQDAITALNTIRTACDFVTFFETIFEP
jgi:hypothetical protein